MTHDVYDRRFARTLSSKSMPELQELRLALERDPINHNPDHLAGKSIWIYTKPARAKLNAIAQAIQNLVNENRRRKTQSEPRP